MNYTKDHQGHLEYVGHVWVNLMKFFFYKYVVDAAARSMISKKENFTHILFCNQL